MQKFFIAIATVLSTLSAHGMGVDGATITSIMVRATDGLIQISWTGGTTNGTRPSCVGSYASNLYALKDETSATGKLQLAMLLTAKVLNKPVNIWGIGDCGRWPDIESLNQVQML